MPSEYTVLFANLTGCAVGISDVCWSVKVVADSEASAVELAMTEARTLNDRRGMPPHGLRVGEQDLKNMAIVCGEAAEAGDPAMQ